MMRRLTLGPIERCKERERLVSPLAQRQTANLDDVKSQKLEGTFKSCITQKVKSRVQATRLQHFKYVKGRGTCTGGRHHPRILVLVMSKR